MSAHAYAPAGAPQPDPERQPRLFALPGGAAAIADSPQRPLSRVTVPVPAPSPARPSLAPVPAATPNPRREARARRTLDAELRLAWTALAAGSPAACIMCDGRIEPHADGTPGGACTTCGTTLE